VATASTERAAPSAPAGAPPQPADARRPPRPRRPPAIAAGRGLWWVTLLIAGTLAFVAFYAKGGLKLETMTVAEMALTLGSGAIVAAVVLSGRGRGTDGLPSLALLVALTVLTGLSVVWSVQPNASFEDTGRMLAYSGVFAAGLALVRASPGRWPAVLGGITLAASAVCCYAILTKVFPSMAPANAFARLEEPLGYWNAVGLTAAMGAIGCMWLGARRSGHALLSALAYPGMGLMLLTLALAYSRGALAALAIGLIAWFALVPLRLRGATVLVVGGLGAAAVAAWDFSRHALSSDGVALPERTAAGHELGALVAAMLILLALAGVAIGFFTSRRPPSPHLRRQAGTAMIAAIVLALAAGAGALAHGHRGLTGSISHAVSSLTDPNAKPPPNTPDRLTAVASVRARYWKEALEVFAAHPALGVGAMGYQTARLRYRKETLEVRHAHGYLVQTLADLGIVGLLLTLALLLTWITAAGRATHPFNRAWSSWRSYRRDWNGPRPGWHPIGDPALRLHTPERIGLLSLLCIVITFGAHSLIDWTWYVPATAVAALLAASWLAGRGPLGAAIGAGAPAGSEGVRPAREEASAASGGAERRAAWPMGWRYARPAIAAAAIIAALLAAWSQWQPQRSEDASQQALALLARDPRGATAAAERAVSRDPVSADALETLAYVQQTTGHPLQARRTLRRAVAEQPSNWRTWLALGRLDLGSDPQSALTELKAAIYLNPEIISPEAISGERPQQEAVEVYNDYIRALRGATAAEAAVRTASARRARAAAAARRARLRHAAHSRARSRTPRAAG
jgi:hypothetical protein